MNACSLVTIALLFSAITGTLSWRNDNDLYLIIPKTCDIPEYFHEDYPSNFDMKWDTPFIVRNYSKSWKATAAWNKANLTRLYGNRKIAFGSEHSIVYGGGAAELSSNFSEFLRSMENFSDNNSSSPFVFQPSILTDIPELRGDFPVPEIFSSWDNQGKEENGNLWHMISIGGSRAGKFRCSPMLDD